MHLLQLAREQLETRRTSKDDMKVTVTEPVLEPKTIEFYRAALHLLKRAEIPFLVGGAYAFARYTGIERHTKDFDLFLRKDDYESAERVFRDAGYHAELTFPHWLGKAFFENDYIDLIYSGGNGIAVVDDLWFDRAVDGIVFDEAVRLIPVEEMICSKAYIMERERFDGADISHLIRARAEQIDWDHLLVRFGDFWRVLLAHLTLFGFSYPTERHRVPQVVIQSLADRLRNESPDPDAERVCQGTILSRKQYLVDVGRLGYLDARLAPRGRMSEAEIAHWTDAIESD